MDFYRWFQAVPGIIQSKSSVFRKKLSVAFYRFSMQKLLESIIPSRAWNQKEKLNEIKIITSHKLYF